MILKQNSIHSTSCSHDIMRTTLRSFHKEVVDSAKNAQETIDIVLSQSISKLPDPARIRSNSHNTKVNFLCRAQVVFAHFVVCTFRGAQLFARLWRI